MQVISRPMQETESWPLHGIICCLQGTVGDSQAKAGQGQILKSLSYAEEHGLKTTGQGWDHGVLGKGNSGCSSGVDTVAALF